MLLPMVVSFPIASLSSSSSAQENPGEPKSKDPRRPGRRFFFPRVEGDCDDREGSVVDFIDFFEKLKLT